MSAYWLVPVRWDGELAVLGEDRFQLVPEQRRERFVQALKAVHPRLLLSFKAQLLPADEAYEACGAGAAMPFALQDKGRIALRSLEALSDCPESSDWPLSHCAEAYLNGLPSPAEAEGMLAKAAAREPAEEWFQAFAVWLAEGRQVILLREEGYGDESSG